MNQAKSSSPYFSVLDGIRGVAAVLVLIRHTEQFFSIRHLESFLAVDLFFILSGVVITASYEKRLLNDLGPGRFTWLRVARIFPLYILGSLIGLAAVLAGKPFEGHLPIAVLLSLFFLPYFTSPWLFPFNNVSWSLFFELFANVVYATSLKIIRGPILLSVMGVCAIGMVPFAFTSSGLDAGWNRATFMGGFFRVGFSFFAGVMLYRGLNKQVSRSGPSLWQDLFSLLLIGALAAVLMGRPSDEIRPIYELAAVYVIFPVSIYLAIRINPSRQLARIFTFLGAISYGLYALHLPISVLVRGVMLKYAGVPTSGIYPWAPWFGVGFVVVLSALCVVADRFYDAPFRKLLLRLGSVPRVKAERREISGNQPLVSKDTGSVKEFP